MDAHKVGLSLVMASDHGGVLLSFMQHLSHIHVKAKDLHENFGRLATAISGAFAITAGVKLIETMSEMVEKGNKIVRVQQNMGQAGMTALEIQKANEKAWELTRKNMNMSAVDILRLQGNMRTIFGDMHHAEEAIPGVTNAGSFLRAYQGKEKGAGSHEALMGELESAVKSGELAAKLTAKEMNESIENLVAMKVAYGDQVKIASYLNAQRRGGVALRNTSDEFRYGIFPALVQEQKQGAGVQMMTAFQKIVAGNTNRAHAYKSMLEYGVADPGGEVEERTTIRGKKTKMVRGSGIREPAMFARNPLEWVEKVLKPALDKITGGNNPIMETQLIGKMFPDRNAQMFLTELLQQRTKLHKDAIILQGVNRDFSGYKDNSWAYQVQAFHTQWENLMTALGAPGVSSFTQMLRKINGYLADLAVYASKPENAEFLKNFAYGIGVLAASLVAGGAAAIVAAIGTIGGVVALITILAGIMATIDWPKEWELFKQNLRSIYEVVEEWTNKWNSAKDAAYAWASSYIASFATRMAETSAERDGTNAKVGEAIAGIAAKLIGDIGTWPEKAKTSILKMGQDLIDRLTAFMQSFREGAGRVTPQGVPWGQINYNPGGGAGGGGMFDARIAGSGNLPAGMRNNNPGNLKFSGSAWQRSHFPGMIGPSANTDQGTPQIKFDTPEHGMKAMVALARTKFEGGRDTVAKLISAPGGWTGGNSEAAANIARTMGVSPSAQINLRDPETMQRFSRALMLQEHGPASRRYTDDMIRRAIGGDGAAHTPPPRRNPPVEVDTTVKLDGRRVSDDKQYEARRRASAHTMAA